MSHVPCMEYRANEVTEHCSAIQSVTTPSHTISSSIMLAGRSDDDLQWLKNRQIVWSATDQNKYTDQELL